MKRREFIKRIGIGGFLIANGQLFRTFFTLDDKDVDFRFLVASDGHYGQPETDYEDYFSTIVEKINAYHDSFPSEFVVYNGDIIHDEPQHLKPAFEALSKTNLPFYVTKGNHDMVTSGAWEKMWSYPQNHAVTYEDRVILLGTTSNEMGEYLCPDLDWFQDSLKTYKSASEIYIFLHITPNNWTEHGVDCPEFHDLLAGYSNVIAVFNGHDHDQDDIKISNNNIPYMFDGHFGGSWGTEYRGFRVVERLKDGTLRTYLMDPDIKINQKEI
ncbi:metallophosphoesterase family protein [Rhodohalobacter sp. 614A]|uniref:metallophosphoesterase family protein n=1 Tax=Rhodohalobacter sp. 614A TaxID=2908649 RepID=UPI001F29562A|nr:metallophosphoesterase [Rhodohalobacter sp. 614A]